MTELIKLEQNITDTIKESQIKLGFTPNAVTLFYPLDSLLKERLRYSESTIRTLL